jgi:hypothetical protein
MFRTPRTITIAAAIAGLLATLSWPALAAPPADWSRVPTKTVKLFFPGQSSYEWLRGKEHKRAFRTGSFRVKYVPASLCPQKQ